MLPGDREISLLRTVAVLSVLGLTGAARLLPLDLDRGLVVTAAVDGLVGVWCAASLVVSLLWLWRLRRWTRP